MAGFPHDQLWLRVLPTNAGHIEAARFLIVNVHCGQKVLDNRRAKKPHLENLRIVVVRRLERFAGLVLPRSSLE